MKPVQIHHGSFCETNWVQTMPGNGCNVLLRL